MTAARAPSRQAAQWAAMPISAGAASVMNIVGAEAADLN